MSYDISIGDKHFNLTYNFAPMFYTHNDKGIRVIYGKTGLDALPILINMLTYFILNKKYLEILNNKEGRSIHTNMTKCLLEMCFASVDHPVEIWQGD